MNDDSIERKVTHPQYQELKAKRSRFGWQLPPGIPI